MDKHNENFNTEIKSVQKNLAKLKNLIEMKYTPEGITAHQKTLNNGSVIKKTR